MIFFSFQNWAYIFFTSNLEEETINTTAVLGQFDQLSVGW